MSKEKQILSEFIEIYKSFPCLWKTKSRDYSDRNAKTQAYNVLIEKLRVLDPEANREAVLKKINCLRTAYRKEMKKVAESEKSGAVEEDVYVPHLWYFDQLHFLKDQDVSRKSTSNLNETQISDNEAELSQSSLPPAATSASGRFKTSQEQNNKCDEVLEVIGKRFSGASDLDKFDHIGKVWAAKLRELDPQQAIHAEKIINDVFYEAQLGNLNRNCFVHTQP